MSTSVLILTDDQHVSSLLEQFLTRDPRLQVTAQGRTTLGATALAWEHVPAAIVVEQQLIGVDWLPLLPTLRRYCPDACILVLCSDGDLCARAREQGADHAFDRAVGWSRIADVLAPPVCADPAGDLDALPAAQ